MALNSGERTEIRNAIMTLGENAIQRIANEHPGWDDGLFETVRIAILKRHKVEKTYAEWQAIQTHIGQLNEQIAVLEKQAQTCEATLDQKLPGLFDRYSGETHWKKRLKAQTVESTPLHKLNHPVGKQIRLIEMEIDRRKNLLLTIENRGQAAELLATIDPKKLK